MLAQIGSALLWMHNRGYAHMDVKPENILILNVKPWQLKLSDFGLVGVEERRDRAVVSREGRGGERGRRSLLARV